MIFTKIPGLRHSSHAGEPLTKGRFVFRGGTVTAANHPLGTAGFSSVGDNYVLPAVGLTLYDLASAVNAGVTLADPGIAFTQPRVGALAAPKGVYPCNKLEFQPEDADHTLEAIASGERMMYYQGGQYETDQWSHENSAATTMTGASFGDMLYLDNLGRLTRENYYVVSGYAAARFIQMSDEPATTAAGVAFPSWGGFYPSVEHGVEATHTSARLVWYELI
jgi:hypothetical protein